MDSITRTVYGIHLQDCQFMGIPFRMDPHTTLNERFGIQDGVSPVSGTLPRFAYFAIGNGGHTMSVGASGIWKPDPTVHEATSASLYKPYPFVLRLPENDLTVEQRKGYALRREEIYDGVRYIAYYLKRIDFSRVTVEMQLKTVKEDGTVTTTPFVPTTANLFPTPPVLAPTGINITTANYVTAAAVVPLIINQVDTDELKNVANIIWHEIGAAIISEIALVSGVDKLIQAGGNGQTQFTFNEVIAAQVVSFINTFFSAEFSNTGTDLTIDVGATEPLFKLTTPVVTPGTTSTPLLA